jgi:hypothetical protein
MVLSRPDVPLGAQRPETLATQGVASSDSGDNGLHLNPRMMIPGLPVVTAAAASADVASIDGAGWSLDSIAADLPIPVLPIVVSSDVLRQPAASTTIPVRSAQVAPRLSTPLGAERPVTLPEEPTAAIDSTDAGLHVNPRMTLNGLPEGITGAATSSSTSTARPISSVPVSATPISVLPIGISSDTLGQSSHPAAVPTHGTPIALSGPSAPLGAQRPETLATEAVSTSDPGDAGLHLNPRMMIPGLPAISTAAASADIASTNGASWSLGSISADTPRPVLPIGIFSDTLGQSIGTSSVATHGVPERSTAVPLFPSQAPNTDVRGSAGPESVNVSMEMLTYLRWAQIDQALAGKTTGNQAGLDLESHDGLGEASELMAGSLMATPQFKARGRADPSIRQPAP